MDAPERELDKDIKPALSRIQLDLVKLSLYLVDGSGASFIKEAISHFRGHQAGQQCHFITKLGNVIANADRRYGDLLPI